MIELVWVQMTSLKKAKKKNKTKQNKKKMRAASGLPSDYLLMELDYNSELKTSLQPKEVHVLDAETQVVVLFSSPDF